MKDHKTEGAEAFIIALGAAFLVESFLGVFGMMAVVKMTAPMRVYMLFGVPALTAALFFWKGRKKVAMGILVGALAPFIVFGGCLLAFVVG